MKYPLPYIAQKPTRAEVDKALAYYRKAAFERGSSGVATATIYHPSGYTGAYVFWDYYPNDAEEMFPTLLNAVGCDNCFFISDGSEDHLYGTLFFQDHISIRFYDENLDIVEVWTIIPDE